MALFREPSCMVLYSQSPKFPLSYIHKALSFHGPLFPEAYVSIVLYYLSPMFPWFYIPRALCFHGPLFPEPYVSMGLYSQERMFLLSYVPGALFFHCPIFPEPNVFIVLFPLHSLSAKKNSIKNILLSTYNLRELSSQC